MSVEFDGNTIIFRCECGQRIRVPAARAGVRGRCKACGRSLTAPTLETPLPESDFGVVYSEKDLITHPDEGRLPAKARVPKELLEEKKSLFQSLEQILKYPVSSTLAKQIFLTGAVLFSPLAWIVIPVLLLIPCFLAYAAVGLWVMTVIGFRMMYFSYLLLIIEKSAEGMTHIPELPVFQTWEEDLKDLVKVLGASAIAFSPYLVYAASVNMEIFSTMIEAVSMGKPVGPEALGQISSSLGELLLLYSIAAFYMPMVLMAMVVTGSFMRAINPVFILRSISRIWREYLAAMVIIFLFLRGSLTLFAILTDVFATSVFMKMATFAAEPILKFYVLVVTMHVIGLLYYRNGERLQW